MYLTYTNLPCMSCWCWEISCKAAVAFWISFINTSSQVDTVDAIAESALPAAGGRFGPFKLFLTLSENHHIMWTYSSDVVFSCIKKFSAKSKIILLVIKLPYIVYSMLPWPCLTLFAVPLVSFPEDMFPEVAAAAAPCATVFAIDALSHWTQITRPLRSCIKTVCTN